MHRAGRTARAGHGGCCITLVEQKEVLHFAGIMSELHLIPEQLVIKRNDVAFLLNMPTQQTHSEVTQSLMASAAHSFFGGQV